MGWADVVDSAALLVTAAGLGVGGLVLVRTRQPAVALAVLMELLTGAGLLRLAAEPGFARAAGAGGVLLVRRVAVLGLRHGWGGGTTPPSRSPSRSRLPSPSRLLRR